MAALGIRNTLTILRESPHGFFLDGEDLGEILLPGRSIPPGTGPGDAVDVFLYCDSDDRLIATTAEPFVMAGGFALLEVVNYHPGTGAFLYWGLDKDLLLPIRDQTSHLQAGDHVLVHVHVDHRSQRMAASMKLDRFLDKTPPYYDDGQPVNLLIASETPLGYKAIVENAHWGLLYHADMATAPEPGQRLTGYVRTIRDDGKIDLSLDPSGYRRVKPLAQQIMEALQSSEGYLPYDDQSSPEEIRAAFNTSKKAFKQALGALYRDRLISFEKPGMRLVQKMPGRLRPRSAGDAERR
jgi:predicted RNA-binding protein (virulence factor B family)